ncbi:MAG: hypothetical protein HXY30_14110 [Pseudorhodoplanes sp.]|nr:hypothetical protein [Pseudorhodoplanes sp.]
MTPILRCLPAVAALAAAMSGSSPAVAQISGTQVTATGKDPWQTVMSLGQRELDPAKFENDALRVPKGLKTHQFTVEYVPPKNPAHTKIYDMLRDKKILEKFQAFLAPLHMPNPVKLQVVGCDGVVNAHFWQNTIQVCYEYFDWILQNTPKNVVDGITPHDAMIGPTADVFLHETGHAIMQLLDIPLLAREEDAADYIATFLMLEFAPQDARRLILGAALVSGADARKDQEQDPTLAELADMHSLPAVRYFNRWCMAYGKDPVLYADAITLGHLTPARAKHCKYEYDYISDAFRRLIRPYVNQDLAREVAASKWFEFDSPDVRLQRKPTQDAQQTPAAKK